MALIFKESKCSICGQLLGGRRYVATTHFITEPTDPLWRYSDSGMHYDCFQKWIHREEFVRRYNDTMGCMVWGNGTRHNMREDGVVESVLAGR